jgi:hypothetical protein
MPLTSVMGCLKINLLRTTTCSYSAHVSITVRGALVVYFFIPLPVRLVLVLYLWMSITDIS